MNVDLYRIMGQIFCIVNGMCNLCIIQNIKNDLFQQHRKTLQDILLGKFNDINMHINHYSYTSGSKFLKHQLALGNAMGPSISNRLKLNFLRCKSKLRQKTGKQKASNLLEYLLIGIKREKRKNRVNSTDCAFNLDDP